MADRTTRVQENKQYFDNEASSYDTKYAKTIHQLIEEIRKRLDFIGVEWIKDDDHHVEASPSQDSRKVRLLDYACGTGLVSRALAPYTTQCVGIDLSENMVARYNSQANNQGLSREEMWAYQGNLCDAAEPDPPAFSGPEFHGFDVAAVGLGFHHFDDTALAARRLASRLRPGGVLLLIDFATHDDIAAGAHHAAKHTITHHGFSDAEVRDMFEGAGVAGGFAMEELGVGFTMLHGKEEAQERIVFLARGAKT